MRVRVRTGAITHDLHDLTHEASVVFTARSVPRFALDVVEDPRTQQRVSDEKSQGHDMGENVPRPGQQTPPDPATRSVLFPGRCHASHRPERLEPPGIT